MAEKIPDFEFGAETSGIDPAQDHIASIPKGIRSKADLLNTLAERLNFPDYFGNNWDALDECMKDFSWISSKRIVFLHEELPDLDSHALSLYINLLNDAVCFWKNEQDHELIIVFPVEARETVMRLLK